MDDDRSSEDGLWVVGGKVEVCEPSIAKDQTHCRGNLLQELCIFGAQGKHVCSTNSRIINADLAEVADVSSFVAFVKVSYVPWIVVATSAAAASSKVTELMDVEAMTTWG